MNSKDIHHPPGEPDDTEPAMPAMPAKTLKDLHAIAKEQAQPDDATAVHSIITNGEQDPSHKVPIQEPTVDIASEEPTQSHKELETSNEEKFRIAIEQLRDELLNQLLNYQERVGALRGPDQGLNTEVCNLSLDYYREMSKLTEERFPREWEAVSRLIENNKRQVLALTVGFDEYTGGTFDKDIDNAKSFLQEPAQAIHYAFNDIVKNPTDRKEADRAFEDVRRRYQHALMGASQVWSQLPKRFGEVEQISDQTTNEIAKYLHNNTGSEDVYAFQRELYERAEAYRASIEEVTNKLRSQLERLNTDCVDSTVIISDKFTEIINQDE